MDNHNLPLDKRVTLFASHRSIPCLLSKAAKVNPPIKRNIIVFENGAIAALGPNIPKK